MGERFSPFAVRTRGDRRGEWVLAQSLETGRQAKELRFILTRRRDNRDQPRPALGERTGFIDDDRVDLFHDFECLGLLDQHAGHARPGRSRP